MGNDKRSFTAKLPMDWRQQIWAALAATNIKLQSAIAVLQLTGCRCKELETGVRIEYRHDDPQYGETLSLTIAGAKVTDITDRKGNKHQRGQPERTIVVTLDSEAASYLADIIMENGGKPVTISYHRKGISTRLGEISREVFPKRKEHVSSYCYRHAFSADQKTGQVGRDTIAAALGQLSDFSQGAYGRARRGGSGSVQSTIISATASRPVKHNKKTERLLRFKITSKFRKANADGGAK